MKFTNSNQKLNNIEIQDFEIKFKMNLPDTYKKVILEYNGGFPEKEYFQGGRIYFEPLKYGEFPIESLIGNLKDILPSGFYPFATDGGGWPYCIDLRNGDNYGKIYFCPMDGNEPEFLVDSFDEFMEELSEDSNY